MKQYILLAFTMLLISCQSPEMVLLQDQVKGDMSKPELQDAYFAGGCFWCMESAFEKIPGVHEVVSGFAGGNLQNPDYEQVASGLTKHAETIQVQYNPNEISYDQLLFVFWQQINPTDAEGQYVDRGKQYRSEIFYTSEEEKVQAQRSKDILNQLAIFEAPIVTELSAFGAFYKANEYHQDFHTKNPVRYKVYTAGSGRPEFLGSIWTEATKARFKAALLPETYKKPSEEELRTLLTAEQFKITQRDGTERPFENEYWDNKEDGIYVDVVSGEPLFSSKDKYVSGTGWPSFTKPLEPDNVVARVDRKLLTPRIEIRSKNADSHLGHLFPDGPAPTNQRWCMNSAALQFIPRERLKEEGYQQYENLFD